MKEAKDLAEKTDSQFVMCDNQEIEYCQEPECNCGNIRLFYLNKEVYTQMLEDETESDSPPPVDEKIDGHWLN